MSGFRELAFVMTVGLLIDTFLVRMLLVPAPVMLVGHRSGRPGRELSTRLDKVDRSAGPAAGLAAATPSP